MKASKRIIHLPIISLVAVMVFSCAPERSGELTGDMHRTPLGDPV